MFLRAFNAFQLVLLFSVFPFIIEWVHTSKFYGHTALFWVLIVGYIVGFIGMVICVFDTLDS